ncbi:MAG: hypothetical protein Q7T71_07585 [Herbiconiux sp.]|nr:hypothetical protein [Herbiconiux sp.]
MTDPRDDEASPWRWPGQWMREEKFWRDIGTRVLAGVVTAAVVYLGALVLGYLHTPEVGEGVTIALAGAAAVLCALGAVAALRGVRRRTRAGRPFAGVLVIALLLALLAAGFLIGLVTDLVSAATA